MNVFLCFVVFVAINCLEFYKCMPVEYEERSAKNIPSVELVSTLKVIYICLSIFRDF